MFKRLQEKRGFTLIELLIVIVIIGILASIVIGLTGANAKKKANDTANKTSINKIHQALETYFQDNDAYPATLDALTPDYLKDLPESTGGVDFSYTPADANTTYTLYVPLLNTNDNGPGVVNGNFQITSQQ